MISSDVLTEQIATGTTGEVRHFILKVKMLAFCGRIGLAVTWLVHDAHIVLIFKDF